jgi:hypothetical protein
MEAKGIAVGIVAKREIVILSVEDDVLAGTEPLTVLEEEGPGVIGLEDPECELELEGA